jgi:hypothetical protein
LEYQEQFKNHTNSKIGFGEKLRTYEDQLRVVMNERSEMEVAMTKSKMDYKEKLKTVYAEKFEHLTRSNMVFEEKLTMYEEQLNVMMKEKSEMEVALRN